MNHLKHSEKKTNNNSPKNIMYHHLLNKTEQNKKIATEYGKYFVNNLTKRTAKNKDLFSVLMKLIFPKTNLLSSYKHRTEQNHLNKINKFQINDILFYRLCKQKKEKEM